MKESQGEFIIGQLWFILAIISNDGALEVCFSVAGSIAILYACILSHQERVARQNKSLKSDMRSVSCK